MKAYCTYNNLSNKIYNTYMAISQWNFFCEIHTVSIYLD